MTATEAANTPLTNRRTPASPVCVTEYAISPIDAARGARRQRVGGRWIGEVGRDPTRLYPLVAPAAAASATTMAATTAAVQAGMPNSPGNTRWPTRGTACKSGSNDVPRERRGDCRRRGGNGDSGRRDELSDGTSGTQCMQEREPTPQAGSDGSERGTQQPRAEDDDESRPAYDHIDDSDAGIESDVFGARNVL